jgi:hypothetical protein
MDGSVAEYQRQLQNDQSSSQAQQQSTAVPLKDNKGNAVHGANGKPAVVPSNFDLQAVVNAGTATGELRKVAPIVGAKATSEDLANFGRGGKWDLQRLSGNFDPRYIDSATILIGMYAAASNISRNQILNIENAIAVGSTYAKGTVMDSTYTNLPASCHWLCLHASQLLCITSGPAITWKFNLVRQKEAPMGSGSRLCNSKCTTQLGL